MTLRMLPAPLLGWLGTLMFLLLMQFLIKYLPDIAGKGLPFFVIIELIAYNLAYMLVLAVPMSILIGMMMVFGRLSETKSYAVIKSAGISPLQLIWPSLVIGLLFTFGMTYFNNIVLPEANFRARNLWQDIRQKRPGFALQAGMFYDGLNKYSILVQNVSDRTDVLEDVLIYDYTGQNRAQAVIKAREGRIRAPEARSELLLTLYDGEMHRLLRNQKPGVNERYERLAFRRYEMRLDVSDFDFERSDPRDGNRSDRTMRTGDMIQLVDSLGRSVDRSRAKLARSGLSLIQWRAGLGADVVPVSTTSEVDQRQSAASVPARRSNGESDSVPARRSNGASDPVASISRFDGVAAPPNTEPDLFPDLGASSLRSTPRRAILRKVDGERHRAIYDAAVNHARTSRALIDDARRSIAWEEQRADRFRVEIHKKYSIAVACLIFVLIGAPLGLSIRRGGLGMVGGLATGIFLFYWITLVQGEKLADRGLLTPWIGMWGANIVILALGIWLMVYVSADLRATTPIRGRLLKRG